MLPDPIAITCPTPGLLLTFPAGTACNFARTDKGRFTNTDGIASTDQPQRLTILPKIKLAGPSSFMIKVERDINVAPVNGIQQSDDTGYVTISFNGNLRSFTPAIYQQMLTEAVWVAQGFGPRILSGES